MFDQPDQDMPHAVNVTPAEQEAIARVNMSLSLQVWYSLNFIMLIMLSLSLSVARGDGV